MSKELAIRVKKVPLYPCRLGVLVSPKFKGVNAFLGKQGVDADYDLSDYSGFVIEGSFIDKRGGSKFCIYLVLDSKELTHGVIAHEVRHMTNSILERICQKLDTENDEAEAYLAQWVTTQVYKALKDGDYLKNVKI